MALHFTRDEFAVRRERTVASMAQNALDGILIFRQESMYYLTGYDSVGYVFFQCLYLGTDGKYILLTRSPDLLQARYTSIVEDVRIWIDHPSSQPAVVLRDILTEQGCAGRCLGVEYDAYGLTGQSQVALATALEGFCTLQDASLLISRLRVVKSEAELEYVRRAASLADEALTAALPLCRPGAFEGDILAALQSTILRGDGDYAAMDFVIGSGRNALLSRYHSGRRHLDHQDQLTLEYAAAYRHYHACLMRTLPIGEVPSRQREMHQVAINALARCAEAIRPGNMAGDVFNAYAETVDRAGYREMRLAATGYSLGATFAPNWMEWPMLHAGNLAILVPGMVIFVHIILVDHHSGLAVSPGETFEVTERGASRLSRLSLETGFR